MREEYIEPDGNQAAKIPSMQRSTIVSLLTMCRADLVFSARRQEKLAARKATASTQPKGTVEVTFPQKGNKKVTAKQGEPLGKVIQRAGMRVKFDCKNGRCATCQVRLNGRASAKVCQGATVRHTPSLTRPLARLIAYTNAQPLSRRETCH